MCRIGSGSGCARPGTAAWPRASPSRGSSSRRRRGGEPVSTSCPPSAVTRWAWTWPPSPGSGPNGRSWRLEGERTVSLVNAISESLRGLHSQWDEAVGDLTPEQLVWRPDGRGNHIAFTTWHYVRTEDNVVRFILQDRRPTVWIEGGWDQKFGLDRIAQGTGWTPEQAAALRLPMPAWVEYQRAVWKACEEYLSGLSEAGLERPV